MNRFPDNKAFAFTIFDDTDLSTVENVGPVYRLLAELGMRTTKSVWPLASQPGSRFMGASLQERDYLDFILELQEKGFEIALHNVRNTHSTRNEVKQGLLEFQRLLGHYPKIHANHSSNRDSLYWGAARFSTSIGTIYSAYEAACRQWRFDGHLKDSPYFWGDMCKEHIEYARNFVFREINLDRVNPSMPYHDPNRRYVNAWFSSSDGSDAAQFSELLSEANQDRLEAECGVCIVYTHLACGFVTGGKVNRRIEALLRRLSKKNGYFVPVSTLLDYLRQRRGTLFISPRELARMERQWFTDRLRSRVGAALSRRPHSSVPELNDVPA